jgi:transposase-like protein
MDTIDQDTDTPVTARSIEKRCQYTKSLKRQMVEETLAGRESVSVIARCYDINANQFFKWGQQYRKGGGGRGA